MSFKAPLDTIPGLQGMDSAKLEIAALQSTATLSTLISLLPPNPPNPPNTLELVLYIDASDMLWEWERLWLGIDILRLGLGLGSNRSNRSEKKARSSRFSLSCEEGRLGVEVGVILYH